MQTAIIISPKDKAELSFVNEFFRKTKIKSWILDLEDIEDIGLGMLMKEADRSKKADKNTVMKKLKAVQ